MRLLCTYKEVNKSDYILLNMYNVEYLTRTIEEPYVFIEDSDIPTFTREPGFFYDIHVNPNNTKEIWISEEARELSKEEKTDLVLNNYDNIVDLFNRVDKLSEEVVVLKSQLTPPPPPLGIFDK